MVMGRLLSSLAVLIILGLATGCTSAPPRTERGETRPQAPLLQAEDWESDAGLKQEWLADLFIQAKEFLRTENHEALYQTKIVREDISSSTANQLSLAYHFRTGQPFGTYNVDQDTSKALYWYARAAGSDNAIAHFNIACLTYTSRQTFRDIPEPYRSAGAMQSMQIAAERGLLFAQLDLSSYYRYGVGVDVDYEWSDYWLKEAEKTLANGYEDSIRPPKPADPLLIQTPPPSGKWEYLYLAPDEVRDWLSLTETARTGTSLNKTSRDEIMAAYLQAGYCSPQDSREAKFLRLK